MTTEIVFPKNGWPLETSIVERNGMFHWEIVEPLPLTDNPFQRVVLINGTALSRDQATDMIADGLAELDDFATRNRLEDEAIAALG